LHAGLRGKIVDFVGLRLLHDPDQVRGVGHVAVVKDGQAMYPDAKSA